MAEAHDSMLTSPAKERTKATGLGFESLKGGRLVRPQKVYNYVNEETNITALQ
jgi:hypothetical protein